MLWGSTRCSTRTCSTPCGGSGYGDEIAVVDTNYPAASTAMSTVTGEPPPMAGVSAARAVEAILSVMPLDTLAPIRLAGWRWSATLTPSRRCSAKCSKCSTAPPASTCRCKASSALTSTSAPKTLSAATLVTGERRFYGDFIFKKGVVPPE